MMTIRDVVAYNDIVVTSSKMTHGTGMEFKEILGHKRVQPSDPDYMGSMYNTQLLWKPVKSVGNRYTRRQDRRVQHRQLPLPSTLKSTLDTPGWKLQDSRNEPRPRNDLSAALTSNYIRSAPGRIHVQFKVPRDYEQAVSIDEDNKNTKWQDSTTKEFREIDE
jgi:hypothetical protein